MCSRRLRRLVSSLDRRLTCPPHIPIAVAVAAVVVAAVVAAVVVVVVAVVAPLAPAGAPRIACSQVGIVSNV